MAEKSSSLYKGSDALYDYDCSSCTEDGLNTEAKHFCRDCEECFCDKCVSHHNKALRKHTVHGRKDVSQCSAVISKVDASVRCDQHQTKPIELYCEDHDQLCCHICVSIEHRRCAAVKHIPDVAKGVHENPNFKLLPEKLKKLRNALETVCDMRQKQLSNLEISGEKVLGQIQTMRRDVNKAFDDLEAHTVAELDKMKSSHEKQVQTDVGIIRDTMGNVQKMLDDIKEDKHKGESSVFISFKKCEEILTQGQSTLRTMEMTNEVNLAFQPYTGILDYLSTLTKLGELSSLPGPDHMFVKESKTHYNACTGGETGCSTFCITGISVFPKGTTLLADYTNKSLKLLNDKFTMISSHNLGKPPISMCYVGNSEVAVAINDNENKSTIQYIRVTDGGFVYTEARHLDHKCYSMACHGDMLFVLSRDTLYLYTTRKSEGRVLYNLKISDNYAKRCAVSPDRTRIFISHANENTLTTLNSDGTVLHMFTDPEMQTPRAIHVSPAGHVFVGCWNGTVLQVSSDGTRKLTTIVDSEWTIWDIWSLCYNTNTGDLVVGCDGHKRITVMKLK